jgi:hypothetical protein
MEAIFNKSNAHYDPRVVLAFYRNFFNALKQWVGGLRLTFVK